MKIDNDRSARSELSKFWMVPEICGILVAVAVIAYMFLNAL